MWCPIRVTTKSIYKTIVPIPIDQESYVHLHKSHERMFLSPRFIFFSFKMIFIRNDPRSSDLFFFLSNSCRISLPVPLDFARFPSTSGNHRLPPHPHAPHGPLMTPPLMNTDYSSEVGTIKDYREQAPFCAGSEQRDHKNDGATFHLHMVEEPRSFLSSTSPTSASLFLLYSWFPLLLPFCF